MNGDMKRLQEQILHISKVHPEKCMKCGKCSASCPSYEEMEFHPHQFPMMVEEGNLEPLLRSPSLYMCLSCYACADRCPRGVEPASLIEAVRLVVIRQQGKNHRTPDDIPGRTDEETPQQLLVSALRKYGK